MSGSTVTHPGFGQPTQVEYTDCDLAQRVRCFLNSRHFPAFRRLEVNVANGSVFVRGHVGSFYEKQVALNSCRRVAGVISLIDEIDVEHPEIGQRVAAEVKPR